MGWRNRVISATDDLVKTAVEARRLVADDAASSCEHGHATYDLDEVVRNLLDAQQAAISALAEIYESCGPFFPRRGAAPAPVRETVKCDECHDYYLPVPGAGCPRCARAQGGRS